MLSGLFQASRAEDLTESPAGLQKKTTEPAFNHDKLCLSTTAPDKSDLLVERRRSPDQSRPRCLLLLHLRLCCCGGSGPIPLSALTSVPTHQRYKHPSQGVNVRYFGICFGAVPQPPCEGKQICLQKPLN